MVVAVNQAQLVDAVKNAQRSSTELKEAWHRYCDSCGGGVRDPSRQTAAFLQFFLAAAANPQAMLSGKVPVPGVVSLPNRGARGATSNLLVQQVKDYQRSSPEAREAWHKYCDEQGGGIRDPSRHNAPFLHAYLRSYGVEPVAQDGNAQAHHANLVERVKAAQRSSDVCKDAWHTLCDDQGGTRDPARHNADVLEAYLATVETQVPPSARPSPRGPPSMPLAPAPAETNPEQAELVAGVKCLQKSSEEMREAWHAFCDNKGLGHRDPARHPPEFLREFVALSAQGAEAVLAAASGPSESFPPELEGLEGLAQRVKKAQRSSTSWKELWHRTCDEEGGGVRDPMKHDVEFLKSFLRKLQSDKKEAATTWEAGGDLAPPLKRPRFM